MLSFKNKTAGELLSYLGFSPAFKGFYYLSDAIALRASDPLGKITAVYYSVSLRYKTTWTSAEKAMRAILLRTIDLCGIEHFCDTLGVYAPLDGYFKLGDFISICANFLNSQNAAV